MRRILLTVATVGVGLIAFSACSTDQPKPASSTAPGDSKGIRTSPKQLPIAEARKKAAAILTKQDADDRKTLTDWIGGKGAADWNLLTVLPPAAQPTFEEAKALFPARNAPTGLLVRWRTDSEDAWAAITQYGKDREGRGASKAATSRDVRDALAALARADKDAAQIAGRN